MSHAVTNIILVRNILEVNTLKIRKQECGNCNIVGKNIERIRKEKGIKQKDFISKMQIMGCDINPTSYSKLEGQVRMATDKEIYAIAKILNVTTDALFEAKK
ncbi:MAG: helix-turn-helix transcriptional regulator [Clostridia bacterium]|nr:helix-turn-helix transcriptional regulator [Clostridia bacterium]